LSYAVDREKPVIYACADSTLRSAVQWARMAAYMSAQGVATSFACYVCIGRIRNDWRLWRHFTSGL